MEIDVIALKGGDKSIYEVKSPRKVKACVQNGLAGQLLASIPGTAVRVLFVNSRF